MPKHFDPNPNYTIAQWQADVISEATTATGVTIDGVLLKDAVVVVDDIDELSSAHGVNIDGAVLKDGGLICADGATAEVDTINEATSAAGVTIDGVLLKDSTVKTDTIIEKTSATGVTIDGVLLKDGVIDAPGGSQILTATGAITINNGVVQLNHATVVIAATLDAPAAGDDLLIVNNSASGTAAHTVTAAAGVTFDGTNNTATLNAPNEALHLRALSATRWYIIQNNGSVGLSSV